MPATTQAIIASTQNAVGTTQEEAFRAATASVVTMSDAALGRLIEAVTQLAHKPPSPPPTRLIEVLQLVATIAVGLIAAFIASRSAKSAESQAETAKLQAETARNQLKIAEKTARTADHKLSMEVFEPRYAVYRAVRTFMNRAYTKLSVTDEDLKEYNRDTLQAEFLFGSEIADYVKALRSTALRLRSAVRDRPNPNPLGEALAQSIENDLTEKLIAADEEALGMFKKYLGTGHIHMGQDAVTEDKGK